MDSYTNASLYEAIFKRKSFHLFRGPVLEQEKTNKKDIFNTKVAGTWFEGKQVYPKQEAVW